MVVHAVPILMLVRPDLCGTSSGTPFAREGCLRGEIARRHRASSIELLKAELYPAKFSALPGREQIGIISFQAELGPAKNLGCLTCYAYLLEFVLNNR